VWLTPHSYGSDLAAYLKFLDESVSFFDYLVDKINKKKTSTELYAHDPLSHHSSSQSQSQNSYLATQGPISPVITALHRLYICSGDLLRYKCQAENKDNFTKAKKYYDSAISELPRNGNPYNQIAVISQLEKQWFLAVYNYAYALMVVEPFDTANPNLSRVHRSVKDELGRGEQDPKKNFLVKFTHLCLTLLYETDVTGPVGDILPEVLDGLRQLLADSNFSDMLLCRIMAVLLFTVLNAGEDNAAKVSTTAPGVSERSESQTVALCVVFEVACKIGEKIKNDFLMSLPTQGSQVSAMEEKKKKRPKQVRNLAPLVVFCQWLQFSDFAALCKESVSPASPSFYASNANSLTSARNKFFALVGDLASFLPAAKVRESAATESGNGGAASERSVARLPLDSTLVMHTLVSLERPRPPAPARSY